MADLSITPANVVAGSNAIKQGGVAGEAIVAGKWVYIDPATKNFLLADSNSATSAARKAKGVALNGAAAGQPLQVQTGGDLVMGGTMTPGAPYFLSETPGGMEPTADLGAGEYVCLLGLARSATVFAIGIQSVDVAL